MLKRRSILGIIIVAVVLLSPVLAGVGSPTSSSGLGTALGSVAGVWWTGEKLFSQAKRSVDTHHVASSITSPVLAARLQKWSNYGFAFEGPWQAHELGVLLDVLDAYGATLGDARFAQIVQTAVASGSSDGQTGLTFLLEPSGYFPSAAWYRMSGQIRISQDVFNDAFMYDQFHWSFLDGSYAYHNPDTTIQHVVLGHELGHVMIDGLNAEAVASSVEDASLEQIYKNLIPLEQYPHQGASVTENLATEFSAWALGIRRTPEVALFRTSFLRATLSGPAWPATVQARLSQEPIASAPR